MLGENETPEWLALEAAVEAYIASESGHAVRDWVLVCATRSVDVGAILGEGVVLDYTLTCPDHTSPHAAVGMLRMAEPLAANLYEDDGE